MRIGILVSGSGSNLQSIIDACQAGRIDGEIAVVISNIPDVFALQRAADAGIETAVIPHTGFASREDFDRALVDALQARGVELVVLAGFMRLMTPVFINSFPGRIMNIHPALLPSFPGLGVQKAAIEHGVRFSGCTVHFVDDGVDSGPIITQAVCPVYPDDTEDDLKKRILKLEHQIYPKSIQLFCRGRLSMDGRRVLIRDLDKSEDDFLINP